MKELINMKELIKMNNNKLNKLICKEIKQMQNELFRQKGVFLKKDLMQYYYNILNLFLVIIEEMTNLMF